MMMGEDRLDVGPMLVSVLSVARLVKGKSKRNQCVGGRSFKGK